MKTNAVVIAAENVSGGIIKLLDALEPSDLERIAALGTRLSVFAGIGRALFESRDVLTAPPAAPAVPPPATVIDYRSTPAVEPEAAEVPEILAEQPEQKSAPEPSTNGNRLPIADRKTGAAEVNRRRIVTLLADRGPMRAAELVTALELSDALVSFYLNGRPAWFVRTEPSNKRSAWTVTAAARAAVGANTVHPADGIPPSEPAPAPAPAPEPPAADPDDPKVIARAQVLAIARAIAAAPNGKATREQIAQASGLEEVIVKNRLRAGGPNSGLPAFCYFSRTEQPHNEGVRVLWGLTHNGAALVREAEGNPQRPSGA